MDELIVCAIRDVKADKYFPPICVPHRAQAVRSFAQECGDKESLMAKWPEDFELWQVGTFDQVSGALVSGPHERMAKASDFKKDN